eukprot:TRINITY_DN6655_c0_g1_i8.p2 TRINITY_DN6655_c0_g1~~TRINITY_DN6655_c0_g1_i8.p2  ORF type:complete len:113 (-),score=13.99 TRINITY_DN6655_c0_g1_i8:345-683(-)
MEFVEGSEKPQIYLASPPMVVPCLFCVQNFEMTSFLRPVEKGFRCILSSLLIKKSCLNCNFRLLPLLLTSLSIPRNSNPNFSDIHGNRDFKVATHISNTLYSSSFRHLYLSS